MNKNQKFLLTLGDAFPNAKNELPNMIPGALCVALQIARDRWSEAEDQKYYAVYKDKIFELASMLEDEPPEVFGPQPK